MMTKAYILSYETEAYLMTQEAVDYMTERDGHCHLAVGTHIAVTYAPQKYVDLGAITPKMAQHARISWRDSENRINHNFIPIDVAKRIQEHPAQEIQKDGNNENKRHEQIATAGNMYPPKPPTPAR